MELYNEKVQNIFFKFLYYIKCRWNSPFESYKSIRKEFSNCFHYLNYIFLFTCGAVYHCLLNLSDSSLSPVCSICKHYIFFYNNLGLFGIKPKPFFLQFNTLSMQTELCISQHLLSLFHWGY